MRVCLAPNELPDSGVQTNRFGGSGGFFMGEEARIGLLVNVSRKLPHYFCRKNPFLLGKIQQVAGP